MLVLRSTRRLATRAASDERGQTLLLFVAVFTVVLVAFAFALDQGLWLGHRRVSQKDADTAARGGAMAYLANPADAAGAADQARRIAINNGADASISLFPSNASDGCIDFKGTKYPGVASVEAQIHRTIGSLVKGLPGLGSVDTAARATACVGQPVETTGGDNFYTAPGESSPDPKCFDANGNPRLGSICPIIVSSQFQDSGSRGLLSLQHDPTNPGSGTVCTEPSANNVDWQVVKGSKAICKVGDQVDTKQTTVEGIKFAVLCRLNGFAKDSSDCKKVPTNAGFPPSTIASPSDAPGNVCDASFNISGLTIPPLWKQLTPPFPGGDVIPSPSGLDDFQEVFSVPGVLGAWPAASPNSLKGTQFLIPNLCSGPGGRMYVSPRIATIIIATKPPVPSGKITIKEFATFYILGCQELAPKSKTTLAGPIDPYCTKIIASTTNLVGIFVRAFIPDGSGGIKPCNDATCIAESIVLMR